MMKVIIWDFLDTLYDSKKLCLHDGAKELLKHLRPRYKQALVSTALMRNKRIKLIKNLGIWDMFDNIQIIAAPKSEKYFLKVCNTFHCKPEEVYVIGDNPLNEMRIGSALGMKTILVGKNKGNSFINKLLGIRFDKTANNLAELSQYL